MKLLRDTILIDTVNLSPHAKKATELDFSMLAKIEEIVLNFPPRNETFCDLQNAKNDIGSFTINQLMRKDDGESKRVF